MEIMTALLIMAFAFLPIIGVIGTSTKDTDVANSAVFAQTTARNILDTLLDDVPFNSIRQGTGNIAVIKSYKGYNVGTIMKMIDENNSNPENGGNAEGTVTDDRGINYTIRIYVWPIEAAKGTNHSSDELLFSYLPRPTYEGNNNESNDKWYTYGADEIYMKENANDPYNLEVDPFKTEVATKTLNAFELGARPNDETNEYCILKKILFKMEWIGKDKLNRSLELYTMKANLDSDGK